MIFMRRFFCAVLRLTLNTLNLILFLRWPQSKARQSNEKCHKGKADKHAYTRWRRRNIMLHSEPERLCILKIYNKRIFCSLYFFLSCVNLCTAAAAAATTKSFWETQNKNTAECEIRDKWLWNRIYARDCVISISISHFSHTRSFTHKLTHTGSSSSSSWLANGTSSLPVQNQFIQCRMEKLANSKCV